MKKKGLTGIFAIFLYVLTPLHADSWTEKTSEPILVLPVVTPSEKEVPPAQTGGRTSGSMILIAFAAGLLGAFMRRSEPAVE